MATSRPSRRPACSSAVFHGGPPRSGPSTSVSPKAEVELRRKQGCQSAKSPTIYFAIDSETESHAATTSSTGSTPAAIGFSDPAAGATETTEPDWRAAEKDYVENSKEAFSSGKSAFVKFSCGVVGINRRTAFVACWGVPGVLVACIDIAGFRDRSCKIDEHRAGISQREVAQQLPHSCCR